MHRFGTSVSELIDRYLWPWEINGHIFVSKKSYYSGQNMQWKASATVLASASFCEVWAKHLKFKDRTADASDGETSEANLALQYVLGKWCIMPSKAWVYTFTLPTLLIPFVFCSSILWILALSPSSWQVNSQPSTTHETISQGLGNEVTWTCGLGWRVPGARCYRRCTKMLCQGPNSIKMWGVPIRQSQLNVHRCAVFYRPCHKFAKLL